MFIAFEGIDGSGKTTLARLLCGHLRREGRRVRLVAEPGGTPLGEALKKLLAHEMEPLTELFLYEASRSELVRRVIRPALQAGELVIADRYALSSLAYQGYGRGLERELVGELNAWATGGLEPDVTFLLDLPPQAGLARKGAYDRMEAIGFLERVRAGYLALTAQDARVVRLDATRTPQALLREVLHALEGRLGPIDSD